MARVYSQLLAAGHLVAPGEFDVGGPEAGFLWVVRDIATYQDMPIDGSYVSVYDLTSGSFIAINTPDGLGFAQWTGRQVVPEGSSLQVTANGVGGFYRISGYALGLP